MHDARDEGRCACAADFRTMVELDHILIALIYVLRGFKAGSTSFDSDGNREAKRGVGERKNE